MEVVDGNVVGTALPRALGDDDTRRTRSAGWAASGGARGRCVVHQSQARQRSTPANVGGMKKKKQGTAGLLLEGFS